MQPVCPQRLPLQSYLHRVIGKDSLFIVVALVQSDAVATSNVNGRDYFYFIYLQVGLGLLRALF